MLPAAGKMFCMVFQRTCVLDIQQSVLQLSPGDERHPQGNADSK